MKVLIVATVLDHIFHFHLPLINELKKMNYTVHVAAKCSQQKCSISNIIGADKVFDVLFERSPYNFKNLKAYKELKAIIRKNDYDIIHCNTPIGGILGRLAGKKYRKKGLKIIYTAHGFHFYKGAPLINWLLYYPVEKYLSKYTDVLITINKEDFERAKRKFKAKKTYYVLGVGIDIDKFANSTVVRIEKRVELGLSQDDIMLLSVGELNVNKNHQVILKAMARLNNPKVHYFIAGIGSFKDNLIKLSNELGINNQLHLLGFSTEIPALLKATDIFCFPSLREGLSVALMEAMSSGVPIIASNIRGNSDLIDDGLGGILVDPNSDTDFASAIKILVRKNKQRENFGNHNKQKILDFSLQKVMQQMLEIYNKENL